MIRGCEILTGLMKKSFFLTIILFVLSGVFLFRPWPATAITCYLDDDFNDTSLVDLSKTTADVDTGNGWVTLARKNLANGITLYEDNSDITLINGTTVETYRYSGLAMEKEMSLSVELGLSDPLSVSGSRGGEYLVLDRERQRAGYYNYDGLSMVENPLLSVNGLTSPLAAATVRGSPDFAVLEDKHINRYSFDGSGMVLNNALSISMEEPVNPVALAVTAEGFDYAVVDQGNNQVLYYRFDGSSIVTNPFMSVTAPGELKRPKSISLSDEGAFYVVVDDQDVKAYNYDGTGMVYNALLSVHGLNSPLAVALKPGSMGSFEYAVLHYGEDGQPLVSYYAFDGEGMVEVPSLKITGLAPIPYANDQLLWSKEITTEKPVADLKIKADVELPANTGILWQVTVDGITWLDAVNNGPAVRFATAGSRLNYRAVLHTGEPGLTPKILRVQLIDASLWIGNMRITDIVGPAIPGNPPLPTDRQVKIWAGYNVSFAIDTTGTAESVAAEISVGTDLITLDSALGTIIPVNPVTEGSNTWLGTFHTDTGVPRDTYLDADYTATGDSDLEYASYPDFAVIYGSALENHPIHLTH